MRKFTAGLYALLATAAICLTAEASAASAANATFTYRVAGLPAGGGAQVIYYGPAVPSGPTVRVDVSSGGISSLVLDKMGLLLRASSGPLTAEIAVDVDVGTRETASGYASFTGGTLAVTNSLTGQTTDLSSGKPFVIPTGVSPSAKPVPSSALVVRCRGSAGSCQARVNIAGGASNRKLTVQLTDTDLRLTSVKVSPSSSRGAYSLSHEHYTNGGSDFVATLNAVRANPPGAHLTLTFVTAPRLGRG